MKTTSYIIAIASLGLFLQVSTGCSSKETKSAMAEQERAVSVRTVPVERAELAESIRAVGMAASKEESRLSFKIGGIIEKIYVKEGQAVRKGQLLATLKLSEINAQVNQAQNAFEKAERDLSRAKNLYRDSVATLEQLQDATTGFEVAKSALTIAKFNQQYASIYAPSSGKVLKRFAEENELTSPGVPILLLADAGQGWVVKVGLADRDAVRVRLGDNAEVTMDAFPDMAFSATVSEIAGAASPMTGVYDVELRLDPKGARLLSGLTAKVLIEPSQKQTVALVPIESFIEGDKNSGNVYTVSNDKAQKVSVKVAFITGNQLAVSKGLENVNRVITDGAAYLKDGVLVTTLKSETLSVK
jgi:RND family efflux transporter MFP subunit